MRDGMPHEGRQPLRLGRLSTPSGSIAYTREGKGPPLLLIHGLGGSRHTWDAVLPSLSRTSTVIAPEGSRLRWWTFAGAKANAVLTAAIGAVEPELLDEWSFSNLTVSLRSDATAPALASALRTAKVEFGRDLVGVVPEVNEAALKKLKFSELLPPALAIATLSARSSDRAGARRVASAPAYDRPTA